MIRAAIAIGSNSTRMLCADVSEKGVLPLARGREDTKLFMGLTDDMTIRPEAMELVVGAVQRLKAQALEMGARGVIALYATSATRDAANASVMQDLLKEKTGLVLQTISGEEEAELAYLDVTEGEDRLVIDIGGGSTELVLGLNGRPGPSASLQLGASRLLKSHPVASAKEAEALIGSIAASPMLREMELLTRYAASPIPACGIGGTMVTFRDIIASNPVLFPDPNLNENNARRMTCLLAPMPLAQRRTVPGLPPGRAVHIVHGLCILSALLAVFPIPSLQVFDVVNLDGWMWREAMRMQKTDSGRWKE